MSDHDPNRAGWPSENRVESMAGDAVGELLALADLDMHVGAHAQALERIQSSGLREMVSPEDRYQLDRRSAYCLLKLGRLDEARAVAQAALAFAPSSLDPVERCKGLLVSGAAALESGNLLAGRADALAVLACMGDESESLEAGVARNLLGSICFRAGESDIARDHYEKGLEIFRKLGDLENLARAYLNLGNLHKNRSDWERAGEQYSLAYYLGLTRGDSGVVAGAAQNLGIVLSKTGRTREARTYLDRGLRLAIEIGDPVRLLRARLALARLDRSELYTARARALLATYRESGYRDLPGREHCLLLIEDARLHLDEGDPGQAQTLLSDLRLRVEAMAPRGDLMIEVLLLEAEVAGTLGHWEESGQTCGEALRLAQGDRSRPSEERAQLLLAQAWARTGRLGEAATVLKTLVENHRARGEWAELAAALIAQGHIALEVRSEPEAALDAFGQAGEILRSVDLRRQDALTSVRRVECLLALNREEEALAQLEAARAYQDEGESFPALAHAIERIGGIMASRDQSLGVGTLDGLQVHERLEAILAEKGNAWERLHEVLALLKEALEVDRAFLARVQGSDLDVLASHGIENLRGRRTVSASALGVDLAAGARVEVGGTGGSRLQIPMKIRGRDHVLVLQRRSTKMRGPLGRAERNYAMVLAAEVTHALDVGSPEHEAAQMAGGIALADVITQDGRMLKILDLIRRIGDTSLSVLLQGETGTGKKLLANAIHRASSRRARPFVTVDCAALPDSLLEAELFGYRKGAFTGATADRTGILAEASGGTVFLDEIDKAGLNVQRRFLHLLDSGEIRPVGSTNYLRLDLRIVCATSCPDLRTEVAAGRFLKDLYYRLNDISIEVPPLRERRDDILLLAGCFIETFAEQTGHRIRGMTAGFRRALLAHDWPGNVRELEKAIRRAVTLADDDTILPPELLPREVTETETEEVEEAGENLQRRIEQFERRAIEQALEICAGNKSRAAVLLGLSRKGLKGKIARYRIGQKGPRGG